MNWLLLIPAGVAGFFIIRLLLLARPAVPLETAKAAIKSGSAVLIDIREPGEWRGGTAKQAALLPFSDLRGARTQWRAYLEKHQDKQLLLYCQSGSRSGLAAAQLRREGFNALNAGSLRAWDRAGWPVCVPRGLR